VQQTHLHDLDLASAILALLAAVGELRMSKTWFGAIGAGTGAVIGGMLWRALMPEYGWIGSGVGAVAGVYAGYWLYDRTVRPRD